MWIFTNKGFYSIVQKPGDSCLTVRARAADLDNLRVFVPQLSALHTPRADYQYRATVSAVDLAIGLGEMVQAIDYSNFKDEVGRRQGWERAGLYGQVWSTLRRLWDGY